VNCCYKIIFNRHLGVWQAVSELARSRGGKTSAKLALVLALSQYGAAIAATTYTISDSSGVALTAALGAAVSGDTIVFDLGLVGPALFGPAFGPADGVQLDMSVVDVQYSSSSDYILGAILSGNNAFQKAGTGALTLRGNSAFFSGDVIMTAGTLTVGNAMALGTGRLIVNGASNLDSNAAMSVSNTITLNAGLSAGGANALTLDGVIHGAGGLIKNGASSLTLNGNNTFSGTTALNAGTLIVGSDTALGSGALNASDNTTLDANTAVSLNNNINLGGNLTLGGANALTLNGNIDGIGGLTKVGGSTLTLNGTNNAIGNTLVSGGTLNVTGSLASAAVEVGSGATLRGTGSLSGALTVDNGAHLSLGSGNVMSVGSLAMNSSANLDVALGAPSTSAVLNVGGNLTLDGQLNATDAGGFGVGVYRLIDYTGNLTDHGLDVITAPAGYNVADLQVQTSVGNQVNLLVSTSTANIRFWDGSQSSSNGAVDGGAGTWDASGTNWTSMNGSQNQTWGNDFAIFQGAAGNITINGTQSMTGMQFVTDGYKLLSGTAAQLTLVNGASGNTAIRVNPGSTATIDVNINGSGTLAKLDSGTLVLNGANSYTGGTALNGGSLIVGNGAALGSGVLTAAAGTTLAGNTAVNLHNDINLAGDLTIAGDNTLTLDGAIGGAGGLVKTGSGNLVLTGANTYSGATSVNAGTLSVNTSVASAITVNNGGTLGGAGTVGTTTVMNGGAVSLATNTLHVSGDYVQNPGGALLIGASSNSNYGKLAVANTATFAADAKIVVDVAGMNTLAMDQTLAGVISAATLNGSTFDVTDNSALFNFTAVRNGNAIDLQIAANSSSGVYDTVIRSGIYSAAGAAQVLDYAVNSGATGDMRNVVTALGSLESPGEVGRAAAQTLPLLSSGVTQVANGVLNSINRLIQNRQTGVTSGLSGGDDISDRSAWVRPFGSRADQNDRDGVSGFKADTWGMAGGIEGDLSRTTRFGIAYAYANSKVDGNTGLSGAQQHVNIDAHVLAIYGATQLANDVTLGFQGDIGQNSNDGTRHIQFGGLDRTATSDYKTYTAHVGLNLAKTLALNERTSFTPTIRADYTWLRDDSYREQGADALNLDVAKHSSDALVLGADARISHAFTERSRLEANVGAGYDTVNKTGNVVANYAGIPGQAFNTQGIAHSPWLFAGGVAYVHNTLGGTEISLHYDVEWRSDYTNQSASVKAKWTF
jgi:autotransporter-associated beta strand protein